MPTKLMKHVSLNISETREKEYVLFKQRWCSEINVSNSKE
jgi:hypothetical protein